MIIPNIFLMPLIGPAALEAIANGAVFLNPKFTPPHGRGNTEFFLGKPTSRNLTSQHPYAEEFVNKSAVVTVDIGDLNAVKEAVKRSYIIKCIEDIKKVRQTGVLIGLVVKSRTAIVGVDT